MAERDLSREEQLRAFDAANETPHRRKHTRRDAVKRLRKAIIEGLVRYDPKRDRVELTAAGRAKIAWNSAATSILGREGSAGTE